MTVAEVIDLTPKWKQLVALLRYLTLDAPQRPAIEPLLEELEKPCARVDAMNAAFGVTRNSDEYRVLDAMESRGGGFVKSLAFAARKADAHNYGRLRAAFPEYWREYGEENNNTEEDG